MEEYQKRMLDEHRELRERLTKLNAALGKDGFREKVGDYQYKLMKEQAQGMEKYFVAWTARMKDMGIDTNTPSPICRYTINEDTFDVIDSQNIEVLHILDRGINKYEEAKAVYELKRDGMSRQERRATERRLAKLKKRKEVGK